MRLFQAEDVQDITERIAPGLDRARQVQLPLQYLLALVVRRGQAQVLDAGAHLIFIVVSGFVADCQSHTTSR